MQLYRVNIKCKIENDLFLLNFTFENFSILFVIVTVRDMRNITIMYRSFESFYYEHIRFFDNVELVSGEYMWVIIVLHVYSKIKFVMLQRTLNSYFSA